MTLIYLSPRSDIHTLIVEHRAPSAAGGMRAEVGLIAVCQSALFKSKMFIFLAANNITGTLFD